MSCNYFAYKLKEEPFDGIPADTLTAAFSNQSLENEMV